jgi:hypothetical protein
VGSIKFPRKHSEFEVQAELYSKLKLAGYNVRGEVEAKQIGRRGCRFDLVIFDGEEARIIIEVKSRRRLLDRQLDTPQLRRYRSWNIPVLLCRCMDEIEPTFNNVLELFKIE